jgi:hypothetical protein
VKPEAPISASHKLVPIAGVHSKSAVVKPILVEVRSVGAGQAAKVVNETGPTHSL